jgi:hypothetical protein
MTQAIKRDARNVGKRVRYTKHSHPRFGRVTTINGFRGDFEPGIPWVTTTDGQSTPASFFEYVSPDTEAARMKTELVFLHGDERFYEDGATRRTSRLRALRGPLPSGMFATYEVTTDADNLVTKDAVTNVQATTQARCPGGRRYSSHLTEEAAQSAILKWASRILRERGNE